MRSFQEYMKSGGTTEKKAVVDASGDQIDMPKPKAKEDPHKKNKTKGEQPQVKEGAQTDKYGDVRKVKGQYVFNTDVTPQVNGDGKLPFSKSKSYDKKDGVEQVKEYLASQGKLVTKPTEEIVSDYKGPNPNAPGKAATNGKGWKDGTNAGSPSPYRAPGMYPRGDGPEHGLGNMGGTKYEPDVRTGPSPYVPGGKSSSTWTSAKTESFLDSTKNMSQQEFTARMLEASCGSDNIVAIKQLATAVTECPKSMEVLVHELKAQGGLSTLIEMLMEHQETFTELNRALADKSEGQSRCHSLARAMSEAVGPPWGKGEEDEDHRNGEAGEEGEDLHPDHDDEDEEEDDEDMEDTDVDSDGEFDDEDAEADDDEMDDEGEEDETPSAGGDLANAMRMMGLR